MELSEYAINAEGRLVYVPSLRKDTNPRTYTVWGLGAWGFIHGVGAYINRDKYYEQECEIQIIDVPSYEEYVRYYDNLNKFRDGRNDK